MKKVQCLILDTEGILTPPNPPPRGVPLITKEEIRNAIETNTTVVKVRNTLVKYRVVLFDWWALNNDQVSDYM